MASMLPQSPDLVRLAIQDIAVNSLTILGTSGISYPNGATAGTAARRNVITSATTLTAAQNGSLCIMADLTGTLYTLPVPAVGMSFGFFVSVTNTSGAHKFITDSASTFLIGAIHGIEIATTPSSTAGPFGFSLNGTTHRSISQNGTTTGGIIGSWYDVYAISATQWMVRGQCIGSGNLATPVATS